MAAGKMRLSPISLAKPAMAFGLEFKRRVGGTAASYGQAIKALHRYFPLNGSLSGVRHQLQFQIENNRLALSILSTPVFRLLW